MQFAIAAELNTRLERSDDIGYFGMPVRLRRIMTRCGAMRELTEPEPWLLEGVYGAAKFFCRDGETTNLNLAVIGENPITLIIEWVMSSHVPSAHP
jgi:hypothetical protein